MTTAPPHIEIDGDPAADPALLATLMSGYGHFTAMQVRDGRVKGLDLHLARLDGATRELFGQELPGRRVRALIAGALKTSGQRDASVRVYVYEGPRIAVTVAPPTPDGPGAPRRLTTVEYWRPAAHIKHLGGFGQSYHLEAARRAGYDEALLTSPYGEIAEGAITNIGFWDGSSLVWPSAPCLDGIAMLLLRSRLESVSRPVTLADLPGYRAAFTTNSRGISPVTAIDDVTFAVDEELMGRVYSAYDSVEWDAL
ncbi:MULTISPECIES: aminotransferase class IV [Streptomyces]|uniref:Aminodeoxychorismate lyase n=1 Tax=Streptomyces venezuelae (strain ATCC 10712 / CBS 650.69 / DSM 40230 / JCM 4526 / NBRC 13096 / PD 04745) TaxID=953739 RepID=F2R136_STRVP|nr:aminotransferase class IV [Streptomyces venezuelae]APE21515.1 class IV aminotransferase [Streptomyces venezuelae]QER98900.1 class IV aminotransferase [Streptomyces venezuelae ATCC 10712]CCA55553.1 Aminodeoxychorismate lyase [Streptomyces venezuelae ATCC 10712]